MIQTERLILRPYEASDLNFLTSLCEDAEVMRYIGQGKVKSKDEVKDFYDWITKTYRQNHNYGLKVLCLKEDMQPVGHAGLVPQKIEGVDEIEIGYWIHRKYWGQGFATEIAQALKSFGLNDLELNKLIALIQPENKNSINVARKIGMHLERRIELKEKDVHVFTVTI